MATKTVEKTLRRMLSTKKRLNKSDAMRLKELVLQDGYLSKSERKVMQHAVENDMLDDSALEIFLALLLKRHEDDDIEMSIA